MYINDRGGPATEGAALLLKWKCYAAAGVPLCLSEGATFAVQVSLKGQHLHFSRHTAATEGGALRLKWKCCAAAGVPLSLSLSLSLSLLLFIYEQWQSRILMVEGGQPQREEHLS